MAIFLSEADIGGLITSVDAIDAAEEVTKINGQDGVINPPRQQIDTPGGYLRLTSAIVTPMKKIAVKVSSSMVFNSDPDRTLLLIDSKTGRVDAIIEVFRLGALRTAAASGVATKYLAQENATSLDVIGAGRQARTQIFAICAVRPIENIMVLGRDQTKTFEFCEEMSSEFGFPVNVAKDHLDLYDCSIICTATTSHNPVLFGKNLRPGTHINSIGANRMERQELDDEVIPKCSIVTVDNKDQAQKESALINRAIKNGNLLFVGMMCTNYPTASKQKAKSTDNQVLSHSTILTKSPWRMSRSRPKLSIWPTRKASDLLLSLLVPKM